jgi:hypothetical protein
MLNSFQLFSIRLLLIVAVTQPAFAQPPEERKPYFPPEKVSVMPILHVPKGLPAPDRTLAPIIYRHIKWAQERYQELLGTTFEIAVPETLLYRGRYTLDEYKAFDNKVGSHIHAQHLEHLNVNRFNCPYVLFTVLYNPDDGFPFGRGGSMNGGFNTGGGTVLMSSHAFTKEPNAQSTIQHELGHAFGLPHIDVYGYTQRGDNPSIMAYNKEHHTNRFRPSDNPGIFIAEDIRGLALNDRVFPNLEFDPAKHIPPGYKIHDRVISNSPASYPESLDYKIEVTTTTASMLGTDIQRTVSKRIDLSPGPEITFDIRSMWHSDTIDGEANIDLKFPFPVELSAMRIYSGHSGNIHPVAAARVLIPGDNAEEYQEVGSSKFPKRDGHLTFTPTESQSWRVAVTPGKSGKVTLRGIRFFSGDIEIFRPSICLVKP